MGDAPVSMDDIDNLLATVLGNLESDLMPAPHHGVGTSDAQGTTGESLAVTIGARMPEQWSPRVWDSSPLVPTDGLPAEHAAQSPSLWSLQLPMPTLGSIRAFDFYEALSSCSNVTLVEFPAKASNGEALPECSSNPQPEPIVRPAAAPGGLRSAAKRSDHDKKERRLLSGTPHINTNIQAVVNIIISQLALLTGAPLVPGTAIESFDRMPQFMKQCLRVQALSPKGVLPRSSSSGGRMLPGPAKVGTVPIKCPATDQASRKEDRPQVDPCCDGATWPVERGIEPHGSFTELLGTYGEEMDAAAAGTVASEQALRGGIGSHVRTCCPAEEVQVNRVMLVPARADLHEFNMQRDHPCTPNTTSIVGTASQCGAASVKLTDNELESTADEDTNLTSVAADVGKPDLVVRILRKKRTSADDQSAANRSVAPRLVAVGQVTSQTARSVQQVSSKQVDDASGFDTGPGLHLRCGSIPQTDITSCSKDMQLLMSVFDYPSTQAADRLSIGVTVLKRMCRSVGICRWPYRKLQRVQALISAVSRGCTQCPEVSSLSSDLRRVKGSVYDNPDIKVDHTLKKQVLRRCKRRCKERQHHPGFVSADDEEDGTHVC